MQALIFYQKTPRKLTSEIFLKWATPLIMLSLVLFLGAPGAEAAVKTWVGGNAVAPGPNAWNNINNWSPIGVPDAGDDVIIPATIFSPIINGGAAQVVGSLEIQLGATLYIDDGMLTVTGNNGRSGNLNNAGMLNVAVNPLGADSFLTIDGTLLNTGKMNLGSANTAANLWSGALNNVGPVGAPVTGTGTISNHDNAQNDISVQYDWESAGTFIPGASIVTLWATGVLRHTSINGFNILNIWGSVRTLASNLVVTGASNPLNVAALNIAGGVLDTVGFDVEVRGAVLIDWFGGEIRATASGGKHVFKAGLTIGDALNIGVGSGTYNLDAHDVTVNITGDMQVNGIAYLGSGDVTILGNIKNAGTFTSTSGNLNVAGSLDNTSSGTAHGQFFHNAGTVIFTDNGTISPDYDTNPGNKFNNVIKRGIGTSTTLPEHDEDDPGVLGDSVNEDELYVLGNLIVESGRIDDDLNHGSKVTVEGDVLVSDNGVLALDGRFKYDHNTGETILAASSLILKPPVTTTQRFNPGIGAVGEVDINATIPSILIEPGSISLYVFKRGLGKTQLENRRLMAGELIVEEGVFHAGEQDVAVSALQIKQDAEMLMGDGTLWVGGGPTVIAGTLSTNSEKSPQHTFGSVTGVTEEMVDVYGNIIWGLMGGGLTVEAGGVYDNGKVPVVVNANGFVKNYGTIILGAGHVSFAKGFENYNTIKSTSDVFNVSGGNFINEGDYNANCGTLRLGKDVTDFKHGSSLYHNLIKSGAGTITTTSESESRTLTIGGLLTVESGKLATDKSDVINISPDCHGDKYGVVIKNAATLSLGDASTMNVQYGFTNEGIFTGAATATLHLIKITFAPGDSDYPTLLKTSKKIMQAAGSTFRFTGVKWTNFGQYCAGTDSTVELNGHAQEIISVGDENAYIVFENINTNNTGVKTFHTDIVISGTFTIAGGATVQDTVSASIPPNVYTFTNEDAKMVISGTWLLNGDPALGYITLKGTSKMNKKDKRWTLILNSGGRVDLDWVKLRDSELITHGGSLNGKNVNHTVVSLGNLSPSWGPFDPVPIEPNPINPSETGDVVLSLQTTNPGANSANASLGDTVNLHLVLDSPEEVNGVSAYLSYDSTVLSIVDASEEPGIQPFNKGDFIGGLTFENSVEDGVLRYTEGNVLSNASGTGVLAGISFIVNAAPVAGATTISFLSDVTAGPISSVSYSTGETVIPTFEGFTLNVEGAPTSLPGDADGDGMVNLVDFSILASVFGTAYASADFNGDGFVNLADFSILAANFGQTAAAAPVARGKATQTESLPSGLLSLKSGVAVQADGRARDLSSGRMPDKLNRGDVVEVAVVAKDALLRAYSFALNYDSSRLQLLNDGIVEGDFLKDTLFMVHANNRVFSATRFDASEGTGVLTKLRFRVVADGLSAAIALRDVQIVDGAGRFVRLPELHTALRTTPHKTRLLANYPNPFNPETWVPFELARDAVVTVRIFNVKGQVVRTLNLGHKDAGAYTNKSAAVYWDGKNEFDEKVSSGIYFYQLSVHGVNPPFQAGNFFSQTRRMLIVK